MIGYNQKIKVIDTTGGSKWRVRPVSMPIDLYKYFKKEGENYTPPGILYNSQDADNESNVYFRTSEDKDDPNPVSKRMAAYVISIDELGTKNLSIFLFPLSAYIIMKRDPGVTGETDWILEKIGFGLATKYICTKVERTELTREEEKIVVSLMKDNPIIQVLAQKVRVYSDKSYTKFDRFDILDLDD